MKAMITLKIKKTMQTKKHENALSFDSEDMDCNCPSRHPLIAAFQGALSSNLRKSSLRTPLLVVIFEHSLKVLNNVLNQCKYLGNQFELIGFDDLTECEFEKLKHEEFHKWCDKELNENSIFDDIRKFYRDKSMIIFDWVSYLILQYPKLNGEMVLWQDLEENKRSLPKIKYIHLYQVTVMLFIFGFFFNMNVKLIII